mgnify:FL=1
MSLTPVFHGTVTKGRLIYDEPERRLVWLAKLEGKRFEESVRRERSQRSLQQNRYYWGVVIEILLTYFEGYTKNELHEALKYKFLSTHEEDSRGLVKIGSTASLSTVGFVKYINEVVRWAAEEKIFIPDPGQVDYQGGDYAP